MNKLRVTVARLGITTIRNLFALFAAAANDTSEAQQISNEEFVGVLMKAHIHLSTYDEASVIKAYKVDDLNVNYMKFMDDLSPPLSEEREKAVKELFSLIQKRSNQENADVILYTDLKCFDESSHSFINNDEASVIKAYKVDDLNVNYMKFMDDLSPPLSEKRENAVKELFSLIQKRSNQENADVILYTDLKAFFDPAQHPDVKMGRLVKNAAQQQMEAAFAGIQNAKDEISLDKFKQYFRGVSSGYPFRLEPFVQFVRGCWCSLFVNLNDDSTENEKNSQQQFVLQIEAMLAEKTRQKIKGTENECNTLLRQFKHYDLEKLGFVTYDQFVHVLESFGVLAPEKELRAFFAKWSKPQQQQKASGQDNLLWYRPFIQSLFETY
eukprot:CAMPEP_0202726022 /NCGR_PEP_ID=MMETSP1385-20130828/184401_1 /ASSEMBLY_ACC=CAM_ASM_000861 /TAXON_ID=933848 /ORGANISM="Elphidium margaritaceum" /LENGTH=381 /DNA_ID=CAMNT_0049392235 /DNA_START=106 /DNA_END=1252 /DNA_ORIENTATION=+